MKTHNISDLNALFLDGLTADQELFAEQRSNVQLIAGEHYTKKGSKFWNRVRDNKELSTEQKIRITKNHIRRIVQIYTNSITSYAPGVTVQAKDESSNQDQKAAELNLAVVEDLKQKQDLNIRVNEWAEDFSGVGELAVKCFWDPMAGTFVGYKAEVDEETGAPVTDENGNPQPSEEAIFTGDLIIEDIPSFNLIRDAGAKKMKESPWLCYQKMVQVDDLKARIEDKEIRNKIVEGADETFVIFDSAMGNYRKVKNQTLLREYYFRPCPQYPRGYFYITTKELIIWEGELPFGIFPIIFTGFDKVQTSPRYRSIVKQLRPYQLEVNRMASKIAEHQVTLGDDKILLQNGGKLTPGIAIPGVRPLNFTGMPPTILAGRSGDQYLPSMQQNITEMYDVANVDEQKAEKTIQADVYAMLYRSLKDKKKFSIYSDKFEAFLVELFSTALDLARHYYTPQHFIPAVGKRENINISEFKTTDKLCYHIKLMPQSSDIESKLGKQLAINHVIQYVGPQLPKDEIGKLVRLMPYTNDDQMLEDLTMDFDLARNIILALDRGEQPQPNIYDNHEYIIKKLTNRVRQPDFSMIPPQAQNNYSQLIQLHMQLEVQKQQKLKEAEAQFIPTGGYLVACDFYVGDPNNPEKLPKRIRLPSEAVQWLINQLDSQGSSQKALEGIPGGAIAQMSTMLTSQPQASPGMGQPMAQNHMPGPNQSQAPMPGRPIPAPMGQPQAPTVPGRM